MNRQRQDGRIPTDEWVVLLPLISLPQVIDPAEGEEIYTDVLTPGSVYHRAERSATHTLIAVPDCATRLLEGLEVRATNAALVNESFAAAVGAVRCGSCRWER